MGKTASSIKRLFAAGEDEVYQAVENDGMKISHDDYSDDDGDYTEELYMIIRADAMSDVISDFLIVDYANTAYGENN